ncbi:MAG: isoprenylcysteine carboxylmethyltransferase family protein, partial [Sulfurifustis sp.]
MGTLFSVLYGLIAYAAFFGTILYAIGFVGNIAVPKSIDSGLSGSLAESRIVNVLLLGVFAIQHSVLARRGFKRWWTKI